MTTDEDDHILPHMKRWLKGILVGIGAIVLSTLGIAASDDVRGISSSLVGLSRQAVEEVGCAADAVPATIDGRVVCIDRFEASAGAGCPAPDPRTLMDTEKNLTLAGCGPQSVKDMPPWRFVSLAQAQRACASAGKRLLSNEEWYRASLGTESATEACHLKGDQSPRTTTESACISQVGAYDMVGNVWEWVDEQVESGNYDSRALPDEGYVTSVDAHGIPLASQTDTPDPLYGEDYMWISREGVRGMVRGGYYGSGTDGGLYTLNASVDLGFGSAGIGFRCGKDL